MWKLVKITILVCISQDSVLCDTTPVYSCSVIVVNSSFDQLYVGMEK